MVKKRCPCCGNYSYSAAEKGRWICPDCGHDMTRTPITPFYLEVIKGGRSK